MAIPRFDGTAHWATLTPEQQAEIGAAALEYVAGWHAYEDLAVGPLLTPLGRAAEDALDKALDSLKRCAVEAFPSAVWSDAEGLPRIPSCMGQICRVCGCSDANACDGGCAWAAEDLCTYCANATEAGG